MNTVASNGMVIRGINDRRSLLDRESIVVKVIIPGATESSSDSNRSNQKESSPEPSDLDGICHYLDILEQYNTCCTSTYGQIAKKERRYICDLFMHQ